MADLNISILATAETTTIQSGGNPGIVTPQIRFIIYILIGTVGIIGNAFVIYIMGTSKKMRSKLTNQFIINQSALDLFGSVLVIAQSTTPFKTGGHFGWTGELFCRIWEPKMLMWSVFLSSTYNLVALTLERYFQVCYPIKHKTSFGPTQVKITIVFVWLFGIVYQLLLVLPTHEAGPDGYCLAFINFPTPEVKRFTGLFSAFLKLFLPVGIMAFAYSRMYFLIRSRVQPKPDENNTSNTQSAGATDKMETASNNVFKMLMGVCIAYFVCWVFNQTFFVLMNAGVSLDRNTFFYHFTVMMAFLNSCINPFIYGFSYTPFKQEVRRRICGVDKTQETSSTG